MCEVPLPNGRRADLVAIDPKGQLIIVEIKVARADLLLLDEPSFGLAPLMVRELLTEPRPLQYGQSV